MDHDTVGVTRPISKHNYLVKDLADLGWILREAYSLAQSGRPGPVVVDICKDVQLARVGEQHPRVKRHRESRPFDRAAADAILDALVAAERPARQHGAWGAWAPLQPQLRSALEAHFLAEAGPIVADQKDDWRAAGAMQTP